MHRPLRLLADQAFARTAGAPLVEGNAVRLLKDGCENYPCWLDAIKNAQQWIHFETYILHDDKIGLYRPVLELAAETASAVLASSPRPFVRVGGLLGDTARKQRKPRPCKHQRDGAAPTPRLGA